MRDDSFIPLPVEHECVVDTDQSYKSNENCSEVPVLRLGTPLMLMEITVSASMYTILSISLIFY